MIIRDLKIGKYNWSLRIYFAVTGYYTDHIIKSLIDIQCPDELVVRIRKNLKKRIWIPDSHIRIRDNEKALS